MGDLIWGSDDPDGPAGDDTPWLPASLPYDRSPARIHADAIHRFRQTGEFPSEQKRCKHELFLDQCGLCKPRPPASPPAGTDPFESATDEAGSGKGRWFRANFDSECSGCDGAIGEGEDIRADGFGGWEGRCCE